MRRAPAVVAASGSAAVDHVYGLFSTPDRIAFGAVTACGRACAM